MLDVPVFMPVNLMVEDAAKYRQYEKRFFPLLQRHSGGFVTCDDAADPFEEFSPRSGRMIISKFPSQEQAKRWCMVPKSPALSNHRGAGTQLESLPMAVSLAART
ncbi:MAG: DUF1330 domain-containing protein [Burkholderiales bacterium]